MLRLVLRLAGVTSRYLVDLTSVRNSHDDESFRDSLPIPSRDDIISSPLTDHAPADGATSGFTAPHGNGMPSPILEDPSDQLEKELAGTHIGRGVA